MLRYFISIIVFVTFLKAQTSQVQIPQQLNAVIKKEILLNYLLYLPENYDKQAKWPVLIFLHGMGERGSNLNDVKKHGIPYELEKGRKLEFIVVSPQCPENSWWNDQSKEVKLLLDTILSKYKADSTRVYLTGLSMGGYGTWDIAMKYPSEFAAIAPVCGGGLAFLGYLLKDIPVWAFHGDSDKVVPFTESKKMINEINKNGGKAELTVYKGVGHNSWTQTYSNPELYKWFLKFSRKK